MLAWFLSPAFLAMRTAHSSGTGAQTSSAPGGEQASFPPSHAIFFNSHFQDIHWTASQEHRKILLCTRSKKMCARRCLGNAVTCCGGKKRGDAKRRRERENLWNSTRLFNCDHMKLRLLNAWSQEANICLGSEAELFTLWKKPNYW